MMSLVWVATAAPLGVSIAGVSFMNLVETGVARGRHYPSRTPPPSSVIDAEEILHWRCDLRRKTCGVVDC